MQRDEDEGTKHSLLSRVIESIILFAACCFLIKLGISYLLAVRIPLIIIAASAMFIIITYRIYKWRKHHHDY